MNLNKYLKLSKFRKLVITKKGTESTSLGLSITHDIIKAHAGTLDIQSKPGKTIFKILLTA